MVPIFSHPSDNYNGSLREAYCRCYCCFYFVSSFEWTFMPSSLWIFSKSVIIKSIELKFGVMNIGSDNRFCERLFHFPLSFSSSLLSLFFFREKLPFVFFQRLLSFHLSRLWTNGKWYWKHFKAVLKYIHQMFPATTTKGVVFMSSDQI